MSRPKCFFASLPGERGKCSGRLVRCHLIDQQLLRREFPRGAIRGAAEALLEMPWRPIERYDMEPETCERLSLVQLQDDPRAWVWGCGGAMKLEGHHGRFDRRSLPRLVVPRERLPEGTEEFGVGLGLGWWLERRYGPLGRSEGAV